MEISLNIVESNSLGIYLEDFKGLFSRNKVMTVAYAISVIGLAGFPITSGFVAKIYLFSAIAHSGLIFIPFLMILLGLTVVALYYYLKLIQPIFEKVDNTNENKVYIMKGNQKVPISTIYQNSKKIADNLNQIAKNPQFQV